MRTVDDAVRDPGRYQFGLRHRPHRGSGGPERCIRARGRRVDCAGRPAPDRLQVTVESEHGGLLLLSEMWLSGWRVVGACSGRRPWPGWTH
ncbi:MAG: hypothetical protein R2854_19215 [Caldilineaceae bacterium]